MDRRIGQPVGGRAPLDFGQQRVEPFAALGDPAVRIEPEDVSSGPGSDGADASRRNQQPLLEAAVLRRAFDPDVARSKRVAEFGEDAELVQLPVELPRRSDQAPPPRRDEIHRRVGAGLALPELGQSREQAGRGGRGTEREGLEEQRREATQARMLRLDALQHVAGDRRAQPGSGLDRALQPLPADRRLNGGGEIVAFRARPDQRLAEVGVSADDVADAAPVLHQSVEVAALRALEQAADEMGRHVEGSVRGPGRAVRHERDEQRVPPGGVHLTKVRDGDPLAFARESGQPPWRYVRRDSGQTQTAHPLDPGDEFTEVTHARSTERTA